VAAEFVTIAILALSIALLVWRKNIYHGMSRTNLSAVLHRGSTKTSRPLTRRAYGTTTRRGIGINENVSQQNAVAVDINNENQDGDGKEKSVASGIMDHTWRWGPRRSMPKQVDV
jgi:hypothetical protein